MPGRRMNTNHWCEDILNFDKRWTDEQNEEGLYADN